jgi:outer membrane murein-binding lipoprotein Lpp
MQTQFKLVFAAILAGSALMGCTQGMHHPSAAPASATVAGAPVDSAMSKMMGEQMQKMQAAHHKAAAAKTPAERQAAMQEGMQTMKDSMGMMRKHCKGMDMGAGMDMSAAKEGMGMDKGMMDMMMKMMDQQSSMMDMPMMK